MARPQWYPDWAGETIVIVASGPTAKDVPLDLAKGHARVIAINDSWRLCPWADILYACDIAWWTAHKGCPEFAGLKVSIDIGTSAFPLWNVRRLVCTRRDDRMEFDNLGTVGWGGNSGFNAYNLAVQLAPSKIILVGYDMQLRDGLHWHGAHGLGLYNPKAGNVERWRRCVDTPAKMVADRGIKVINCSPTSALRNYPKMSFAGALAA